MIKLIIFDVDGTLVDAYKAVGSSLNFVLTKFGCPKTTAAVVKQSVGWGDRNFIDKFIAPKDARKALRLYREHHQSALLKYSKTTSGAKEVLAVLKKRNYKLAIASNRPSKFTNILLKHLGLFYFFDIVICARNEAEIKPSPRILLKIMKKLKVKKDEVLYIGDMAIDVCAGKNAGIRTIAVKGGSSTPAQLRREKPYKIIHKISVLLNMLKDLNSNQR